VVAGYPNMAGNSRRVRRSVDTFRDAVNLDLLEYAHGYSQVK
jgi:hypothetical protein